MLRALLPAVVAAAALAAVPVGSASAVGASQPTLVSAVPGTNTPNIADGTVYAITQVGNEMIVGGSFTTVTAPGTTTNPVTRDYLFGYDATTGAISTTFVPQLNAGPVEGLAPGPQPNTVYVAGSFTTVNGATSRDVALIDTQTGQLVSGWAPSAVNGAGWTVKLANGRLFLGGNFTTVGGTAHAGLVTLDPNTGKVQPYIQVQVAGHHNYTGQPGQSDAPVGVHRMDISPDGTRLVAVGNFKTVDGVTHDQIMMVDLGATSADVDPNWNTSGYTATCASNAYDTYMRDIAFSPDGSYFAVAATGGGTFDQNTDGTRALCDTVTRWNTTDTGTDVQPAWIDYTGNDSFESIATTGTAIYLGGHERWVNNSLGHGLAPARAPSRARASPRSTRSTALPYAWNPGRNPRGAGAYALLVTPTACTWAATPPTSATTSTTGAGSRSSRWPAARRQRPDPGHAAGQRVHGRAGAERPPTPTCSTAWTRAARRSRPSTTARTGRRTTQRSQPVPQLGQQHRQLSAARPRTTAAVPADHARSASTTPSAGIRARKNDGQEMQWSFPVTAGMPIEVRLYFANNYSGTSQVGQRVFDVSLDGTPSSTTTTSSADAGDQTGTMKAFDITSPPSGEVTIDFTHEVENPLINGIEIVRTDQLPPTSSQFDTVTDRLVRRHHRRRDEHHAQPGQHHLVPGPRRVHGRRHAVLRLQRRQLLRTQTSTARPSARPPWSTRTRTRPGTTSRPAPGRPTRARCPTCTAPRCRTSPAWSTTMAGSTTASIGQSGAGLPLLQPR